jgi:hypothetical protein
VGGAVQPGLIGVVAGGVAGGEVVVGGASGGVVAGAKGRKQPTLKVRDRTRIRERARIFIFIFFILNCIVSYQTNVNK